MTHPLIDPQAMLRLRVLCKLDHARVARLCGLTPAQVHELEGGEQGQFPSNDMKVQAALKLASTLSGKQASGMPVVNVFRSRAVPDGLGVHLPAFKVATDGKPQPKPKFPDTPEFYKLLLIFVVMVFLLVAVAMPLLFALPSPAPKFS